MPKVYCTFPLSSLLWGRREGRFSFFFLVGLIFVEESLEVKNGPSVFPNKTLRFVIGT